MQLRLVLLIAAIALLAIAAAGLVDRGARRAAQTPERTPAPALPRPPEELQLSASRPRQVLRVPASRATTLLVSVRRPSSVAIAGSDLVSAADSRTPARFDLLFDRPGRRRVVVTPVGGRPLLAGTIAVFR